MTDRDDPERMRWARPVFERAERIATLQPKVVLHLASCDGHWCRATLLR
jgi:SH3-like domain-containing protein